MSIDYLFKLIASLHTYPKICPLESVLKIREDKYKPYSNAATFVYLRAPRASEYPISGNPG